MTEQERKTLINKYKDGYRAVAEDLAGAPDRELDARPAPNKWSAREIVHHLAAAFRELNVPREHYRQVNVAGTRNVLNSAAAAGARRFIYCSTNASTKLSM